MKKPPVPAREWSSQVMLQAPQTTRDAIGQPLTSWVDVAEVFANISYASGLETIKAGADTSLVKASIMIRPRTGLTAAMRAVDRVDGTVYAIHAVLPDKVNKDRMYLTCQVVT